MDDSVVKFSLTVKLEARPSTQKQLKLLKENIPFYLQFLIDSKHFDPWESSSILSLVLASTTGESSARIMSGEPLRFGGVLVPAHLELELTCKTSQRETTNV